MGGGGGGGGEQQLDSTKITMQVGNINGFIPDPPSIIVHGTVIKIRALSVLSYNN